MPFGMSGRRTFVCGAFGLVLVLVACDEQNTYAPPPPPSVTVAQPLIQDVTEYLEKAICSSLSIPWNTRPLSRQRRPSWHGHRHV